MFSENYENKFKEFTNNSDFKIKQIKKKHDPKTLSSLLYRRPGSNRHVLADTGFYKMLESILLIKKSFGLVLRDFMIHIRNKRG